MFRLCLRLLNLRNGSISTSRSCYHLFLLPPTVGARAAAAHLVSVVLLLNIYQNCYTIKSLFEYYYFGFVIRVKPSMIYQNKKKMLCSDLNSLRAKQYNFLGDPKPLHKMVKHKTKFQSYCTK